MSWIEREIVLVPNKGNKSEIIKHPKSGLVLRKYYGAPMESSLGKDVCQELYVLSNEAVKTGEWCFELHDEYESDLIRYPSHIEGKSWYLRQMNMNCSANDPECKKIIASSEKLIVEDLNNPYDPRSKTGFEPYSLPLIPFQFLSDYVIRYNNWNQLHKAMVEYNDVYQIKSGRKLSDDIKNPVLRIKTNNENHIFIKPPTETWSREELLGNNENSFDTFLLHNPNVTQEERELVMELLGEWIDNF